MTSTVVATEQDLEALAEHYREVRSASCWLCEPLETEDYVVQSMPDASPVRWHLAHTSWFFETIVLKRTLPGYRSINDSFEYLFNSYYNTIGAQFPRPQRGMLTRPTVTQVMEYREYVDANMAKLLDGAVATEDVPLDVITLGLHHERQHQELIVTDVKHMLSHNPLYPVYREAKPSTAGDVPPLDWYAHPGGLLEIGFDGGSFAYDNEGPRHRVYVESFQLANRLVTNGEYLAFMADGGYERPEFWLSDGWYSVTNDGWKAPLYWIQIDGKWMTYTLSGLRDVEETEPVTHVSHYEADAYAQWAGARLPTEAEWEVVAEDLEITGNFVENAHFHPVPLASGASQEPAQMFGDVWEWTQSAYTPYPGYRPPEGALGEYNAKFMSSQLVLRGGSCATPRSHIRVTYRNFFQPYARWQFSGIRLARDAA